MLRLVPSGERGFIADNIQCGALLVCVLHSCSCLLLCKQLIDCAELQSIFTLPVAALCVLSPAGFSDCPGTVMKQGITVCLYFLPPQRFKEIDWFMMEGISRWVAVVPVIAKADTFTEPEMVAYRREILQVGRTHGPSAQRVRTQEYTVLPAGFWIRYAVLCCAMAMWIDSLYKLKCDFVSIQRVLDHKHAKKCCTAAM